MKLNSFAHSCLIFIGVCFGVHAETESLGSNQIAEIVQTVVEENNTDTENKLSVHQTTENELDTTLEKSEEEKPKGPAIGYVPDSALKRFNVANQASSTDYDLEKIQFEIFKFEQAGNHDKAIELLRELNNKHPNDKTIIHLTRLLLKTGDYKQAEIEIKPLCHVAEPLWQSCFLLGTAQLVNKQLEEAAQSFDLALLSNVDQAVVWLNRAIVEQERNDHDAAIQLLSVAHKLKPNDSNIVLNLAISNEAAGHTDIAFEFYKQFLQLASNSPENKSIRFSILSHLTTLQVADQ